MAILPTRLLRGLAGLLCTSAACSFLHAAEPSASAPTAVEAVVYSQVKYSGNDAYFSPFLPGNTYQNPILAGFYPDPSICRVGDDYYLINSSFAYFPGVPIFHSRDLVNWTQIGHVLDRPSQLKLDGHRMTRGLFAPTIRYNKGRFYMITTLIDTGGNFFVTATKPQGPWSDPTWLPEVDGIDPSFFFDEDGRAWIINNGPPPENKPLYEGHRAIWIQEFNSATGKTTGPRQIIVNGGVDLSKKPVWIEGPHIYKKDGWYVLTCAEGGTAEAHSQVVLRSRTVTGPYLPWASNPILTQRDLPDDRPNPITCTGHADLVEGPNGNWWSVFLGCRPYQKGLYNTGRETFLLPVSWNDGWPRILAPGRTVPSTHVAPNPTSTGIVLPPTTGNFTWDENFRSPALAQEWVFLRSPGTDWLQVRPSSGTLAIYPRPDRLTDTGRPSFVARRQQHTHCTFSATLQPPADPRISAGLAAFHSETNHYFFALRNQNGGLQLFVDQNSGKAETRLATRLLTLEENKTLQLRIRIDAGLCSFDYSTDAKTWTTLLDKADATILSTHSAGGFVGTVLGLHARLEP